MKAISLLTLCFVFLIASAHASVTNIEEFLKTRPSYKKMTQEEIEEVGSQYRYDVFFADSAYRSERGDVTVTVLVRKGHVIGYHVQITYDTSKENPIDGNDMEAAIAKAYDLTRYTNVRQGHVGKTNYPRVIGSTSTRSDIRRRRRRRF